MENFFRFEKYFFLAIQDTGKCINSMQLCNNYPDCDNAEDEYPEYCEEYRSLVNRREPVSPLLYANLNETEIYSKSVKQPSNESNQESVIEIV